MVAGIRTPQPLTSATTAEAGLARRGAARGLRASCVEVCERLEHALPRHAGHRVHDRAGQALTCCRPAPASAPRRRRCRIAVDMVDEGADRPATRRSLRVEPDAARPAAAPDARPARPPRKMHRQGPAGLAGRRVRHGRVHRRRRRASWAAARRGGDPGARSRPRPRTSTACRRRQGILTARGGMTATRRWSRAAWASACVAGCRRRCAIDYAREALHRRGGRDGSTEGDVDHASTARPAR